MLRNIFEKIPSIITKTDVPSTQVNYHFIRPFSHVKRSYSCADGERVEEKKCLRKACPTNAFESNLRRLKNKQVEEGCTKAIKGEITFVTPNSSAKKKHFSRYNLDEKNTDYGSTFEKYQLEAAKPRKSKSELTLYDLDENEKLSREPAYTVQHLQPGNLKPLAVAPNVVPNVNDDGFQGNLREVKKIPDDYLGDIDNFHSTGASMNINYICNSLSSSSIPRPSYSEYVRSKITPTDINIHAAALLPADDLDVVQKRTLSTITPEFCKVADEKVDEATGETEADQKDDNASTESIQHYVETSKKEQSTRKLPEKCMPKNEFNRRTFLRRLNVSEDQLPLQCYSDYIKTKSKKSSEHFDVAEKIDTISATRPPFLQNVSYNSSVQKREYSNMSNSALEYVERNRLKKSNSYRNVKRPVALTGAHCLSKSSDGLCGDQILTPLATSRTFVMCPAYSDYLKNVNNQPIVAGNKDDKNLLSNRSRTSADAIQRCLLSSEKAVVPKQLQTLNAITSLNETLQNRSLSTTSTTSGLSVPESQAETSTNKIAKLLKGTRKQNYSSKKCKPKPDPCVVDDKPKRCFLPPTVRLKPNLKCSPKFKPCPIEPKCPPRADDCLCIMSKKLPRIQSTACVCIEPYVPDKAPALKRLKFHAPDPIRYCPPPECTQPRADDSLIEKPKHLKPYKAKPCECIEPPPIVDVPLIRLKKICVPEPECYPPKPCPPPEPCIRADDLLCDRPKQLPILTAPLCPCIDETVRDVPPLKRLNLKYPEPPRICPKPCVCDVDCPRADDNLVIKPKPLRQIKAGDCPCVETEMVDVDYKRLECREDPEECIYTDPCDVPQPRADFGCWEYYIPKKKVVCPPEVVIKSQKICKKRTKKIMKRPS